MMPGHNHKNSCEKLDFSDEVFRRMKNLRLLNVHKKCVSYEPTFLPNKLRWLCWFRYPFPSLPVEHMRKLVGLEMPCSDIEHLWKRIKILPNLKFVDLSRSHYLTRFPDISGAPNIERLILSKCFRLAEVHESLGFHKKLVYLDMSKCMGLKSLPSMIEMESLETLILSNCKSLERFPEVSPSMVKLSEVYLDNCVRIKELPSSMGYLSGLSYLNLISCADLKNIPNSVCKLKHLKRLYLHDCKELQKLPDELGIMDNLEELFLGGHPWNFRSLVKYVSFRTLTNLCSLRKLDLSYRQIEEEDFPQDLRAFSSLEELNLSGNSQLTRLPTGISYLSQLKLLEFNDCSRLQNLNGLPSGLQVLRARGCSSLEKIGDLSQKNEWLYKAWLIDCHKLLEDQENEQFIDKLLQQSFLKKCAAVDHRLSIIVPGKKIPSWFGEQHQGCNVALRLPCTLHTEVSGFAICGVFYGYWKYDYPKIIFKIVNDGKATLKSEVNHIEYAAADNCNLWVTYIPFSFFQQMYKDLQPQDWSHIKGDLFMTVTTTDGNKSVNCAANVVYKEDVKLIQQLKTCIPEYGNLVQVDDDDDDDDHVELGYERKVSANTYVHEEISEEKDSHMRDVYNRRVVYKQGGFIM